MTYKGNVEIVERDDENHRAVMRARARETRGQGTADARVALALVQEGETTKGTMKADVQLAGRAAAMGRGVIQDVSAKIVSTFAKNLEAMLSSNGAAPEAAATETAAATEPAASTEPAAPTEPAAGTKPAPATEPAAATEAATPAAASAAPSEPQETAATPTPPPSSEAPATPPPPAAAPRPQPAAAPAEEASLPVGQIVGAVLLGRLKDPKVLGALGAVVLVLIAVLRRGNR
jgi:hypothetical protein